MVPLKQDFPTTPFNTQFSGQVALSGGGHEVDTEVSFDVASNAATLCRLGFSVATGSPGGPWTLAGSAPYRFAVFALDGQVDRFRDSWASHPAAGAQVATVEVAQTGAVTLTGGVVSCLKGQPQAFVLRPEAGRDLDFTWFGMSCFCFCGGVVGFVHRVRRGVFLSERRRPRSPSSCVRAVAFANAFAELNNPKHGITYEMYA